MNINFTWKWILEKYISKKLFRHFLRYQIISAKFRSPNTFFFLSEKFISPRWCLTRYFLWSRYSIFENSFEKLMNDDGFQQCHLKFMPRWCLLIYTKVTYIKLFFSRENKRCSSDFRSLRRFIEFLNLTTLEHTRSSHT